MRTVTGVVSHPRRFRAIAKVGSIPNTLFALFGATVLSATYAISPAAADSVISMQTEFTGVNIYAPDVLYDTRIGGYVMWYGGWTRTGQTNDEIYYRISTNGTPNSWGTPETIITKTSPGLPSNTVHVNDPSVTETTNGVTGLIQYTMFFTLCVGACGQADQEIWSATSSDGMSWSNYQVLLSGAAGPADPYALYAPSGSTTWLVYYANRVTGCNVIQAASVNGNRNATGLQTVLTAPNCVDSPNLANFTDSQGAWHLFYQELNGSPHGLFDIYEAKSSSFKSFSPGTDLIANPPNGPVCTTETPFALPLGGSDYELFFGEGYANSGDCSFSLSNNLDIAGWTWKTS